MKRNDYIQLLSGGLLTIPEDKFQELSSFISQRFETVTLRKPQTVSIGGRGSHNEPLGLVDWARELRKEKIQAVTFFYQIYQDTSLEPHIAAAFAGVEDTMLRVTTAANTYFYMLHTQYSPSNEMTPDQLVVLVNAQYDPAAEWKRIEELIQTSNELNNRPRIAEGSVQTYLTSPQGCSTFEWKADDFVKELQLNAIIFNRPFIIPESLKELLQQSSFSFDEENEPRREYNYLYPVEEITAQDLISLIEAQSFANDVLQKGESYFTESAVDNGTFRAATWKGNLKALSSQQLQIAANVLCRFTCESYDEKGGKPVVPEALKTKFGPDHEEAQRIVARGKLENSQWFLASNLNPWELHLFEHILYDGEIKKISPSLKVDFISILKEIEKFALKIQSDYAEAFRLAGYLLSDQMPSGTFDEAHKNKIIEDLQSKSYSSYATENFSSVFYYSQELLIMNWPAENIYAFMAANISDVFGGMGSWNDMYQDTPEDQEEYRRLSAQLFDTLKKYFAALISSETQS